MSELLGLTVAGYSRILDYQARCTPYQISQAVRLGIPYAVFLKDRTKTVYIKKDSAYWENR